MEHEDLNKIQNDEELRKRSAYEHPFWFSWIYLRHHVSCVPAPFHLEMFHLIESPTYSLVVVMAFRESGKSTVMNLANVLWSILGKPQRKFIVIVSKTQDQAKNHFANLKNELMTNELLRADFGPFTDNEVDWKKTSLELVYHGSKIMSVSLEQSIRGLKYGKIRPDLIIADDIEDVSMAQDDITRDRAWQRLMSEIMPLGSTGTKIVILGNLICPDSIMMRLKEYIEAGRIKGIFRAYPLLDDKRRILWPDRFIDLPHIVEMKRSFTDSVWTREFLLKILGWEHGRDSDDEVHARISASGDQRRQEPEKITYQKPLVTQMKPYAISVPIDKPRRGFSTDEEVDYQRYYGNVDIEEPMRTAKEIFDFETSLFSRWDLIIKDHMLNATPQEEYEAKMAQAEKECEVEFKFGSSSPS